jgi:hypothetical protein
VEGTRVRVRVAKRMHGSSRRVIPPPLHLPRAAFRARLPRTRRPAAGAGGPPVQPAPGCRGAGPRPLGYAWRATIATISAPRKSPSASSIL